MSHNILPVAGLRWWTEEELEMRDMAVKNIGRTINNALTRINRAWTFRRIEAPMLIPRSMVSPEYKPDDIWMLNAKIGDEEATMRPETTEGTYREARRLMTQSKKILPMCLWQVGKSYRRETNDGASASKLRFYEFTQAEWQCLYSVGTMADYRAAVLPELKNTIGWLCNAEARIVPSDRLPAYSERTDDIEVDRFLGEKTTWTEVASISTRTDFSDDIRVLEIAVGIDRIVDIAGETGVISR